MSVVQDSAELRLHGSCHYIKMEGHDGEKGYPKRAELEKKMQE